MQDSVKLDYREWEILKTTKSTTRIPELRDSVIPRFPKMVRRINNKSMPVNFNLKGGIGKTIVMDNYYPLITLTKTNTNF